MSRPKEWCYYEMLMRLRGHHVSVFWDGGACSGALSRKVLKNGYEYWQVKWEKGWFQFQTHNVSDIDEPGKRITCSEYLRGGGGR